MLLSPKHAGKQASLARQPSLANFQEWEGLKELFTRASVLFENDETLLALPLLRDILRECHRLMTLFPDPSVIYTTEPKYDSYTAEEDSLSDQTIASEITLESLGDSLKADAARARWAQARKDELPTAFHATLSITLFYMGKIINSNPSLALADEPGIACVYWLAALDVFETGESLLSAHGGRSAGEDWRMAIYWGRTLICLAERKLIAFSTIHDAGTFSVIEPVWSQDSLFHAIAAVRPPLNRRMWLQYASAHDILVLAMDQFSRGIFHMPRSQSLSYPQSFFQDLPPRQSYPQLYGQGQSHYQNKDQYTVSRHYITTPPSVFSHAKQLFTIASEVLSVAARLPDWENRQYWANWAESLLGQMETEVDVNTWKVTRKRGRCWLMAGCARIEGLETGLGDGETNVLNSEQAEEAREDLNMAISFLERAQGFDGGLVDNDAEDVSSLLVQALLALANLTIDPTNRAELYERAKAEDSDIVLDRESITPTPNFPEVTVALESAGVSVPSIHTLRQSPSEDTVMDVDEK